MEWGRRRRRKRKKSRNKWIDFRPTLQVGINRIPSEANIFSVNFLMCLTSERREPEKLKSQRFQTLVCLLHFDPPTTLLPSVFLFVGGSVFILFFLSSLSSRQRVGARRIFDGRDNH